MKTSTSSSNPLPWVAINAGSKAIPKQLHSMLAHGSDASSEVASEQIAPEQAEAPTGTQEPPGGAETIDHDLDSDFVFEGGMVEPFIEGSIIMLVPEKYQTVAASVGNIVICLANHYILESLSIALGIAINPIGGVNTTAIALAMIKKTLKELQKKVDILMHADFKTAFKRYQNALSFMSNPKLHKKAFKEYKEVVNLAERAYSQVNDFDQKILCKKLALFGHLMTFMYDNEKGKKTFLPLEKLSEDVKGSIATYVRDEISVSIEDYKMANSVLDKGWFSKKKKKLEKDKNQNLLDSFLKYGLPLIWHYNKVFCEEPKDSQELLQFIPEGEKDAAQILMTNGQWINVWKDINQEEEQETFLWSLKNVPHDTDPETYVGYVDGILKCKFKCIDSSTSRFQNVYRQYKREPREVRDNEVCPCEVKFFFKFWEFPLLVFRFEVSTHIVALETKSLSVVYYNMEPMDLTMVFQNPGEEVVSLGIIETCPKSVFSMAKRMKKITLYDNNDCGPKKFLMQFFTLDKTKRVQKEIHSEKIKSLLAKCPCDKDETCKKGTFVFHHQEASNMFDKINEMETLLDQTSPRSWYKKFSTSA